MPVFAGQPLKREALYFHYPNYAFHQGNRLGAAIRSGPYKLIKNFDDGSVELYNLKKDISEKEELSKKYPELAQRLKGKLETWLVETKANMPKVTGNE